MRDFFSFANALHRDDLVNHGFIKHCVRHFRGDDAGRNGIDGGVATSSSSSASDFVAPCMGLRYVALITRLEPVLTQPRQHLRP